MDSATPLRSAQNDENPDAAWSGFDDRTEAGEVDD